MSNLVTGKVRFSYVQVFEPKSINGGDEKYSVTLLIPKSDSDTCQKITAEVNRVLQESVAEVFKGVMPTNPSLPIYDGDGLRPSGEPFGAECKGHWVISAKSSLAPEIVDASCNPIISKNEFYSGCYGRASLRFYAYNRNGNKGVGCGLGNVQKLEDGQPLGGRTTAAEDFGAVPAQPMQYQQPVMPQTPTYQPQMPVTPLYNQPAVVDPITGQPLITGQTNSSVYGGV